MAIIIILTLLLCFLPAKESIGQWEDIVSGLAKGFSQGLDDLSVYMALGNQRQAIEVQRQFQEGLLELERQKLEFEKKRLQLENTKVARPVIEDAMKDGIQIGYMLGLCDAVISLGRADTTQGELFKQGIKNLWVNNPKDFSLVFTSFLENVQNNIGAQQALEGLAKDWGVTKEEALVLVKQELKKKAKDKK